MDEEGANWCRLAQAIMNIGAEVCRQFLQLEIVTKCFVNYSEYWKVNVHNPAKTNYLAMRWTKLKIMVKKRQHPSEQILHDLLNSFSKNGNISLMEQIYIFKQWMEDIKKKRLDSNVSSVDDIINSWLSQIEKDIQDLTLTCTLLSKWNNAFHGHLKNAQSSLLSEIENNDELVRCFNRKLKSLSSPTSSAFKQLVQKFKQPLEQWKVKCLNVLNEFKKECCNLIKNGLPESQGVPKPHDAATLLNDFKKNLDDQDSETHVDQLCNTWADGLVKVIDRYETQIQEEASVEDILKLAQSMVMDLEKFCFKEEKIRDFFSAFVPPPFPKILERQSSKLRQISGSSDLIKCDLTLLIAIWQNGKFVNSPPQGREEDPHNLDTSICFNIMRLREHRNNIVAHIAELKIPNDIFEKLWEKLTVLLCEISSRCGDTFNVKISSDINTRKNMSLDKQNEYKLRKEFLTWCKNDILAQISAGSATSRQCLDMLQSVQKALDNLSKSRQVCTCRICEQEFSTEREFVEHMIKHQAFICLGCKQRFVTENEVTNHMSDHHQVRACSICRMECRTGWEFRRHMWCNQDCKCLDCDEAFLTENKFEEHIMQHQAITCGICKERCSSESEIRQHMSSHQVHKCLNCSKEFSTATELERHMRDHQARKCLICNMDLASRIDLEEHMRTHQARTCCGCNQEFSTESELAEHVRNYEECSKGSIGFFSSVFRK